MRISPCHVSMLPLDMLLLLGSTGIPLVRGDRLHVYGVNKQDYFHYNSGAYGDWPLQTYYSTDIVSPLFLINRWDRNRTSNASHIVMAPTIDGQKKTPMIFSSKDLSLVYADPEWDGGSATAVQMYNGEPHLSFWLGHDFQGHGNGEGVLVNSSYAEVKRVNVSGIEGGADSHEFQLTDDGGALLNNFHTIEADISSVVGPDKPQRGKLLTNSFQEVDLATGAVRFSWNAIDHFNVSESRAGYSADEWGWDWFHMNSLQKTPEGNYLISIRHLKTVALINGTTGNKIWQLGGVHNDFTDLSGGNATNFGFQHMARFVPGSDMTEITLFDNEVMYTTSPTPQCTRECSRGLRVKLDYDAMTARIATEMYHPESVQAWAEGGVHAIGDGSGNFMVGYGVVPAFAEFNSAGECVLDVQTRPWYVTTGRGTDIYRVYKLNWKATPPWDPSIAADCENQMLHVSWNGATEVAQWSFSAGKTPEKLRHVKTVDRVGFETSIVPPEKMPYYRATALDGNGTELASSPVVVWHCKPSTSPLDELKQLSDSYSKGLAFVPIICVAGVLVMIVGIHVWYWRRKGFWGFTPVPTDEEKLYAGSNTDLGSSVDLETIFDNESSENLMAKVEDGGRRRSSDEGGVQ